MSHKVVRMSSGLVAAAVAALVVPLAAGNSTASTASPRELSAIAPATGAVASAPATKAGWTAVRTPSRQLQLISPAGARRTVATIPAKVTQQLVDVSADGRRFLFSDSVGPAATFDAQTKVWTRFDVGATGNMRLTRPTGTAILVLAYDSVHNTTVLRRYGFDGRFQTQLSYPDTVTGQTTVLPAPDGMTYLTPGRSGGMEVHNNATGALIKTIPMANGDVCAPRRWWADGVVMAACSKTGDYVTLNAFTINLATGKAVQLSRVGTASQPGIDWAWPTPSGKIVARQVVLCGPAQFGILKDGRILKLVTYGNRTPDLIGVSGNRMVMAVYDGCGGPGKTTLATQDVATGTRAAYGPIASAVVIDPRS